MKTPVISRSVSCLAVVPMLLSAQPLRDNVPLRHWPAPLYWQADHTVAEFRPLTTTTTAPNLFTFIAMTPCRVVDTRAAQGFSGAFGPPSLNANASRTFPIQSSTTCSIPSSALAYSFNVSVVPPGIVGYITIYPTGQALPLAATLTDTVQGNIQSNSAIVPGGTNGSVDVYAQNPTDLVIDINGYYAASFGAPTWGYDFPNASGTPLMMIAPTGNVGIGTTTPGSTLDVAGDINLSGELLNNGSPILSVPSGGDANLAVGANALSSNTSGSRNTATGFRALQSNTTGFANTGIGANALSSNTTGSGNTATGGGALQSDTTGSDNTGIGGDALHFNTTGNLNTGIGVGALAANTTGGSNTGIGAVALFSNTTGSTNTGIGDGALKSNTTGNNNTGIGGSALSSDTTGSNNVAIGALAAFLVSNGNSNNIHIGTKGASADNGTIRIGGNTNLNDPATQTQFFVSGVRGTTTGNNDAIPVLIDSAGQLGTVSSSRTYKEDIQDMGGASSGLLRLRPVTFRYQKPFADGSKPIQYGLIAEEVAEVYPNLVAHSADGQIETVKYQVLDSMLLNEVQRQQREIGSQREHIQRLEDQLSDAQQRLARLEAVMASVASSAAK